MEKKRAHTEDTQVRNESSSNDSEKEPGSAQSMGSGVSTSNEASKCRFPSASQKRKKTKLKQLAKEIEGTRPITSFFVSREEIQNLIAFD